MSDRLSIPNSFKKGLVAIAAIVATGAMLTLALPLGEQFYLAWFVFVPVLRVVRSKGFLVGFVIALLSIFVAAGLSVTGIFYLHRNPHGSSAWVLTAYGIFGFALCLAVGAWADRDAEKLPVWWFGGLAVMLEAYLLVQITGHIALTQYRQVVLLQLASIGGVWLVSYLLWYSNFYLATLEPKRLLVAIAVIVPASLLLSFAHETILRTTSFGVVQIAEPDDANLTKLQREVSESNPTFVVWPAFGGIPFAGLGSPKKLIDLSKVSGIAPIITSYPDSNRPLPHNTAGLFAAGRESQVYWKRKLFGGESKMNSAGTKAVAVPYAAGTVGLNICFDSCYPSIIRETANLPNVNVIALASIDPEATNDFVAAMHASYTPFRAAENGVSIIKCDGIAYSMFVDPYGQIVKELGSGDQIATAALPIATHKTFYKRFGDWFLYLLAIMVFGKLAVHVRGLIVKRKSRDATNEDLSQTSASLPSGPLFPGDE